MRLTVRRRIIIALLLVSLIPLLLANVIWLFSSQAESRTAAANQQKLLVKSSADAVGSFLTNKIDSTIIHSQTAGVQNLDLPAATADLEAYLKQDEDLRQIQLIDATGRQRLRADRNGTSTQLVNMASDDAFRIVTFLGGKEYISPVLWDERGESYITLAVPLINYTKTQGGQSLTTAESGVVRSSSEIKGALIVKVAVARLWESVLANTLGKSGYAYVVDAQGLLIAHPDADFVAGQRNLTTVSEVMTALAERQVAGAPSALPQPVETVSEKGEKVLSSHARIGRTGWIVVAQEPIRSVYEPVRNGIRLAVGFFAMTALLGLVLVFLMARGLLRPVGVLAEGASKFGSGDLAHRIALKRQDEFGMLAQTFNDMAAKISDNINQLQNIDKLKNEFILITSHNLRTPLTVISNYIDLMRVRENTPETQKILTTIDDNVRQLSEFSEAMLTISTIESGNARLDVASISVEKLLEPLRASFDTRARQKDIELSWDVPEPQAVVSLSPVHIRSALANLIGNALEFTPSGGRIAFSFNIKDQHYIIAVRDTGSGISPAEAKRLFTKFHRGTSTMQYNHEGIGVGLYVTGLVVKAHHGIIEVQTQPGKGSQFTISIPKPENSTDQVA